jgi:hypothetical protein
VTVWGLNHLADFFRRIPFHLRIRWNVDKERLLAGRLLQFHRSRAFITDAPSSIKGEAKNDKEVAGAVATSVVMKVLEIIPGANALIIGLTPKRQRQTMTIENGIVTIQIKRSLSPTRTWCPPREY